MTVPTTAPILDAAICGLAGIGASHPMPRPGAVDDLAALTQFPLSRDADWVTGQIIGVDGGRSSLRVGKA